MDPVDRERRELERRAYGRDGSGLSAAETARLAELRRAAGAFLERAADPAEDGLGGAAAGGAGAGGDVGVDPRPGTASATDRWSGSAADPWVDPATDRWSGSAADPRVDPVTDRWSGSAANPRADLAADPNPDPASAGPNEPPGPRTLLSRIRLALRDGLASGRWTRPRYLLGAIAVLLLIGIVIGVSIPKRAEIGLALRAGEAERRDRVLAAIGDYDPGSVILLARTRDARLWYATQASGTLLCAVLDLPGVSPERQCSPRQRVQEQPIQLMTQMPFRGAGRTTDAYAGVVTLSGTGVPLGSVQFWGLTSVASSGLNVADEAILAQITRETDTQGASVVGRIGEIPVWLGYHSNGERSCMIVVDGEMFTSCLDHSALLLDPAMGGAEERRLSLELPATDVHPAFHLDLRVPIQAAPYLIITPSEGGAPLGLGG